MTNLKLYREKVKRIRQYAAANNISENEVNEIFEESFKKLESKGGKWSNVICKIFRYIPLILFSFVVLTTILYNHSLTHNEFIRKSQSYIYPSLKVFRKFAVPIIYNFPRLTELYDEWCLVENPYFQVSEMDCWPCSSVHSVLNLTGTNITNSFNVGIPYIQKYNRDKVTFKELHAMFWSNAKVFEKHCKRISSSNAALNEIKQVMEQRIDLHPSSDKDTQVIWKINRIEPARLIRKLFPSIFEVPKWWSQSTEKFVFIDEPKAAPYPLPNAECSNIFLWCTNGERLIKMIPSTECQHSCKTFMILLPAQHVLWYNWWYWRPVSFPVSNSTSTSISYMTSFC